MTSILRFNRRYFVLAILLLIIEILIALYVHDKIVRPYIGDFLVVILIYCFLKSFLNTPVFATGIAVLIFSYSVEILQYLNIVDILGLQNSSFARIIIGNSFAWIDIIAYTAGVFFLLCLEKIVDRITIKKINIS